MYPAATRIGTVAKMTTAMRHATMCASVMPAAKLTRMLKMVPITVPVRPPRLLVSALRFAIMVAGVASRSSYHASGCDRSVRKSSLRMRRRSHSLTKPNAAPLTK